MLTEGSLYKEISGLIEGVLAEMFKEKAKEEKLDLEYSLNEKYIQNEQPYRIYWIINDEKPAPIYIHYKLQQDESPSLYNHKINWDEGVIRLVQSTYEKEGVKHKVCQLDGREIEGLKWRRIYDVIDEVRMALKQLKSIDYNLRSLQQPSELRWAEIWAEISKNQKI